MRIKTHNSYEATWYYIKGGHITHVRLQDVKPKRAERYGFNKRWVITMEGVPADAVKTWRMGRAMYPLDQFRSYRLKLKRAIREYLDNYTL